ncbi:MAG: glycoside hydrolase family 3 C-terminal domain-containing protein [Candidatus Dormibacteraceae bacterium]
MDTALVRLFTARIRLGMFDPPSMVPYSKIDEKELDGTAHRELARRMADESMVLLKNDGVLPLKSVKRIAIVGPLADQTAVLLGNYNGQPTHTVSVLEGMKTEFPNAKITYVPGTQFLSLDQGTPVPPSLLTTPDGKPGLKAEYSSGTRREANPQPLTSRIEAGLNLNDVNLPEQAKGIKNLRVQWTGFLNPNATGNYLMGIRTDGFATLSVDGEQVTRVYGNRSGLGRVHLDKGQPVRLDVTYGRMAGKTEAQLIWTRVNNAPDPAAITAAKNADVVIAVVGITSRLEGEEMPVDQPGFLGGDRTSLDLPEP